MYINVLYTNTSVYLQCLIILDISSFTDIDECTQDTNPCAAGTTCSNTAGSYDCSGKYCGWAKYDVYSLIVHLGLILL